jgi:hypothetical protein
LGPILVVPHAFQQGLQARHQPAAFIAGSGGQRRNCHHEHEREQLAHV